MFVTKERYEKAVSKPMELALSRNERYGDSISIMETTSIIDLILMKLVRTKKLPKDDDKYYDEVEDCLNYLVYILMRKEDEKK